MVRWGTSGICCSSNTRFHEMMRYKIRLSADEKRVITASFLIRGELVTAVATVTHLLTDGDEGLHHTQFLQSQQFATREQALMGRRSKLGVVIK